MKKESNFELLRIICMLMIITGHTFSWGGILKVSSPKIASIIYIVYAIILVEVNCFILITGYFQSKSKFKAKKFIKLLSITYFYKVFITVMGYYIGWFPLSKSEFLWQISPFDFSNYWFIKIYLILYCLSPFINKFINLINRKIFRNLLIVLFVFCSVLVTLTNQQLFTNCSGYSLVQFVFMYLIGAYLRKYIISPEKKAELYKNKIELLKDIFISISIFILCFLANYILFKIGSFLVNKSGFLSLIGNQIKPVFMNYDNPLVILGSVGFFMFFALLNIKNKFINIISSVIFPVYLIHETAIFRPVLYSWFGLNKLTSVNSYKIFLVVFIIAITIFIGSVLVEYIRRFIFFILNKILYQIDFVKKMNKKYNSICNKIDSWINC